MRARALSLLLLASVALAQPTNFSGPAIGDPNQTIVASTTSLIPTTVPTTTSSTTSTVTTTTVGGTTTTTVLNTFYSDSYTPTGLSSSGSTPANIGIQFSSAVNATVTDIQFYKPPGTGNGGTHVGYMWRVQDQALMGQVTFGGETASGWQTATFAPSIPLVAGFNYRAVVSATAAFDYQPGWPGATSNPGPFTAASGGVYALAAPGTYPGSTSTDWYLVDIKWTVP